ncbi:YraN family protein [Longirhabdus pacifica]|uniref:YraN family protein n=1 Tax=Longirhabdus pacifica TaxID=2305227 RepID=UPI001008DCAE|nr:YraN family protein [Longirhabdus pacifica]
MGRSKEKKDQKDKAYKQQLGKKGEEIAFAYLISKHHHILQQNWRCRFAEIDIISKDGDTLVFTEVRTRSNSPYFGTPEESVDAKKQNKIRQAAQFYMQQQHLQDLLVRFDVIGIHIIKEKTELQHIEHAF